MAEFNLADVLRDVNAQDLGQAGREKLVYLDIDLIDPDPKNFYELSDLDELAANIELIGLQQPVRVRVHPDNPERYMIVSGHRRRAAIRKLVDEGKDQLRAVACIIEQPAASEALQELRLIYANSDTRKMTSAEISKQAERVEELLYQLKKEGMEFPGRMRDHVAQACQVSASKLGRLRVIRKQLIPELKELYEAGNLSEDAAYFAAATEKEIQYYMLGAAKRGRTTKWQLEAVRDTYRRNQTGHCEICSGPCDHLDTRMQNYLSTETWLGCNGKCCANCTALAHCSFSCGICADKKAAEIAAIEERRRVLEEEGRKAQEERAARQAEEERIAAEIAEERAEMKKQGVIHWLRVGERRKAVGLTAEAVYNGFLEFCADEEDLEAIQLMENGEDVDQEVYWDSPLEDLDPFGLCFIADQLQCSTEYLLGRTNTPQPAVATLESMPIWRDPAKGELPGEGETVIAMVQHFPHGPWKPELIQYTAEGWKQYGIGLPEDMRIIWQPNFNPDTLVSELDTIEEE